MNTARSELFDLLASGTWFEHDSADIQRMQLAAVREQFQIQREQIPFLASRAEQAGVKEISALADVVPLLFSDSVYKSYPEVYVEKKRWDRMLDWLRTLSAADPRNVSIEGVGDADDWLARLHARGHLVMATSGTSGKCSFLNVSADDRARKTLNLYHVFDWPRGRPDNSKHVFFLGPKEGYNSLVDGGRIMGEIWAKPGGFHPLFEEPLRVAEVSALAKLNRRLAEGSASAEEVLQHRQSAAAKATRLQETTLRYTDQLLEHRHEPLVISGLWAQMMPIIDRARQLGVPDGDWHPDTRISLGGGVKSVRLPDDYKERVKRFFGPVIHISMYGMTESAHLMPRCEAGRYHTVPSLVPLLLNWGGDGLQEPSSGVVEGRFGFVDLTYQGRWGGLISGDKVQLDFSPRCQCGRSGPTILDTISRFSATNDDNIGCAGTIDAYARGVMA
jgi:hypothetical protein